MHFRVKGTFRFHLFDFDKFLFFSFTYIIHSNIVLNMYSKAFESICYGSLCVHHYISPSSIVLSVYIITSVYLLWFSLCTSLHQSISYCSLCVHHYISLSSIVLSVYIITSVHLLWFSLCTSLHQSIFYGSLCVHHFVAGSGILVFRSDFFITDPREKCVTQKITNVDCQQKFVLFIFCKT